MASIFLAPSRPKNYKKNYYLGKSYSILLQVKRSFQMGSWLLGRKGDYNWIDHPETANIVLTLY